MKPKRQRPAPILVGPGATVPTWTKTLYQGGLVGQASNTRLRATGFVTHFLIVFTSLPDARAISLYDKPASYIFASRYR